MAMEAKPPPSDSEKGVGSQKRAWAVMMQEKKGSVKEESEPIKLGLAINGAISAPKPVIKHEKSVITPAQLHELQQQSLIFKYIKDFLPVPLYLVVPVWKSVAAAFGSANGAIYKQYPSFVGFSSQGFDYRNMMDPEPGRCRRTDGKKWRCGKNVIPDQKYCERHIHRGRQRSRKPVESQMAKSSDNLVFNSSNYDPDNPKTTSTHGHLQLRTTPPSKSGISIEPAAFQRKSLKPTPKTTINNNDSANNIHGSKSTTNTITTIAGFTNTHVSSAFLSPSPLSTAVTAMTKTTSSRMTTSTTSTNSSRATIYNNNKDKQNFDVKGDGCLRASMNGTIKPSSKRENSTTAGSTLSLGLGFSPKSVLQVAGCNGLCHSSSQMEVEPGRCRRTDGKKWRCRREVVPDQKYCPRHMHRGARKHKEASHLRAMASTSISPHQPHSLTKPNKSDRRTLSTDLCISTPESPRVLISDEKSSSSTSSEATITDITIAAYGSGNFSS